MLLKETEYIITNIFLLFIKYEAKIEKIKNNLYSTSVYNKILFKILDKEKKSFITDSNILAFLSKNGIVCEEKEIKSIIKLYDNDQDNYLNYEEFLYLILPNDKLLDKEINTNYNLKNDNNNILNNDLIVPNYIKNDFCDIFRNELEFIRIFEKLINVINARKDFNIYKLFNILKDENENKITYKTLSNFMKRNEIYINNSEIIILYNKLDINKDGIITLEDLNDIFANNNKDNISCDDIENIFKSKKSNLLFNINKENINNNSNTKSIKLKEDESFNLLIEFFILLIKIEKIIELKKIDLSLRSDFNIYDFFNLFKRKNTNYISEQEFKNGLHNLGVIANNNEIILLMKKYYTKNEYFLDNSDIFDMIIPFDKNCREIIENRKQLPYSNNKRFIFPHETRQSLANLFKIIISCENTVEKERKYLKRININFENFFNMINIDKKGYIYINDFLSFFNCLNIDIETKYIYLLFVRLDKKKTGMIERIDLINEINPTIQNI